jgi:hypothetical protein
MEKVCTFVYEITFVLDSNPAGHLTKLVPNTLLKMSTMSSGEQVPYSESQQDLILELADLSVETL